MSLHILLKLRPILTFPLGHSPFSDSLHNGKGLLRIHPLVNQIGHNIVTGTDCRGNRGLSRANQFLGIVKPHIRSMGKSGNPNQIRQGLRLGIHHHLNNKIRSKFRYPKASHRTSSDILRRNSKD